MSQQLSGDQKRRVNAAVDRVLWLACPEIPHDGRLSRQSGISATEGRIDVLVDIVRNTTAKEIEPYLEKILEGICTTCTAQSSGGACLLRTLDQCALYSSAQKVVAAIAEELESMRDPEFLRTHRIESNTKEEGAIDDRH